MSIKHRATVTLEIRTAEPEVKRAEPIATWEFLSPYEGENEPVSVIEYPKVERKKTLIGADDLVTAATNITFTLDYPLGKPVAVAAQHPEGFTRLRLYGAVYTAYKQMYDACDPAKIVRYSNLYNVEMGGPYGIWGHSFGDLSLNNVFQLSATEFKPDILS